MCPRFAPAALAASAILLSACSLEDSIRPYRIDVRQGNLVTPEMVARLEKGMSPDQVRFVLGTPLIVDPFHSNRWDYAYRFQPGRGEATAHRLTVFFRDGVLAEVEGDVEGAGAQAAEPVTRVIEIDSEDADN